MITERACMDNPTRSLSQTAPTYSVRPTVPKPRFTRSHEPHGASVDAKVLIRNLDFYYGQNRN